MTPPELKNPPRALLGRVEAVSLAADVDHSKRLAVPSANAVVKHTDAGPCGLTLMLALIGMDGHDTLLRRRDFATTKNI
jgi:hypothetical protein